MRKEAFPFDWLIIPTKVALAFILKPLDDFCAIENLVFLRPTKRLLFSETGKEVHITDEVITPVVDVKYGILFPHDFSASGENDYPQVADKYSRRMDRLRRLVKNENICLELMFTAARPNDWQLDQFAAAGCDHAESAWDFVEPDCETTAVRNWNLMSLDRCRERQRLEAPQSSLKRIKQMVRGLLRASLTKGDR